MGDDLFTVDIVREFILARGGKVTNTELVLHFKPFVNDPNESRRAGNRKKFKDFVNTVANVKLDDNGEKFLVLKKRYKDGGDPITTPKNKGFVIQEKGPKIQIQRPKAKIFSPEEIKKEILPPEEPNPSGAILGMAVDFETDIAGLRSDEVFDDFISKKFDMNSPNTSDSDSFTVSTKENSEFGDEKSNDGDDENSIGSGIQKITLEDATIGESTTDLQTNGPTIEITGATVESSSTDEKLEAQLMPVAKPNNEIIIESKIEDSFDETEGLSPVQINKDEDANDSVISVRERAKHLNKIESSSNLIGPSGRGELIEPTKVNSLTSHRDEDRESSVGSFSMTEIERQWMQVSAASDYQEMAKLLVNNRYLAKRKDFISGFTPLHWAAKHGQLDVVKLLCGVPGVDYNAKTHGGYTPLHLAAMHGHDEIHRMLVQSYGADVNARDYSGKLPKHYLRNSGMNTSQSHLTVTSRIEVPSHHTQPFRRIPSWSAKIQKGKKDGMFTIKLPQSDSKGMLHDNGRRSPSPSPFSPVDNKNRNIRNNMASIIPARNYAYISPKSSPTSTPPLTKKFSQGNSSDDNNMPPPRNIPFKRKKKSKSDMQICSDSEADKNGNDQLSDRKMSSSRSMFI